MVVTLNVWRLLRVLLGDADVDDVRMAEIDRIVRLRENEVDAVNE